MWFHINTKSNFLKMHCPNWLSSIDYFCFSFGKKIEKIVPKNARPIFVVLQDMTLIDLGPIEMRLKHLVSNKYLKEDNLKYVTSISVQLNL